MRAMMISEFTLKCILHTVQINFVVFQDLLRQFYGSYHLHRAIEKLANGNQVGGVGKFSLRDS